MSEAFEKVSKDIKMETLVQLSHASAYAIVLAQAVEKLEKNELDKSWIATVIATTVELLGYPKSDALPIAGTLANTFCDSDLVSRFYSAGIGQRVNILQGVIQAAVNMCDSRSKGYADGRDAIKAWNKHYPKSVAMIAAMER